MNIRLALVLVSFFSLTSLADSAEMTLPQIFEVARARLESVKIQELQTKISQEALKQVDSHFFPKLSFLLDYTRIQEPTISSDAGVSTVFYDPNQYDGRFALTLTGAQGFREYYARKIAVLGVEGQKELEANVKRLLLIDVTAAYYSLLSARSDLANLELLMKASKEREREIAGFVRLGRSRKSDLLQQETQLSLTVASVVQAKSAVRSAEDFLKSVSGVDTEATIANDVLPLPGVLPPLSDFLTELNGRADIAYLKSQVDAAEASIKVAEADYYPSIDLKANLHAFRSGVLSTSYWDFGFSLNVPIFEGFRAVSAVRSSGITFNKNRLSLLYAKRTATKEIQTAYDLVQSTFSSLSPLKEASEKARAYYDAVRKDYEQKLSTNLDVNLALNQYYGVLRSYKQSVYQFKAAFQSLAAISGRLS